MSSDKDTFAFFGKNFQESLCQLILLDRPFSDQIKEVLVVEFLELKYLQVFAGKIFDYKEKYKVHPTYDIMTTLIRTGLEDQNEVIQKQVRDYFARILDKDETEGAQFIKETSLDFCKKQKLKEAMLKSVKLLQSSSFDEISKTINDALKLGSSTDFGYDYLADFEKRFQFKSRNPVTTGWQELDEISKGGLGAGELGVVIAPTGAGKSMVLVHLGTEALKLGKTVIHYTLELADSVVASRYDSCLTGVNLNELLVFKDQIFETVQNLQGKLIVKEYPTKSATTNTIKIHLEKLKMRDIIPDLIIVDYGDLLRPISGQREKRQELESIYEELRGIAQENNCPVYTASQTNRCFFVDTKLPINRNGESKSMRIGDVKEGDLVETHKGMRKITKVFPQEVQQTYKITLKSGKTMICSGKHQFPTASGELKSIEEGLSVSDKLLTRK